MRAHVRKVKASNKKRNYKKEYANYQGKPAQIKRRAQRNKARRKAVKAGRVRKGDGKDIDHPTRNTSSSKTRVLSASKNRSHGGKVGNRAGKARGGRISGRIRKSKKY